MTKVYEKISSVGANQRALYVYKHTFSRGTTRSYPYRETRLSYSATRWCIYTLEMEALSGVL